MCKIYWVNGEALAQMFKGWIFFNQEVPSGKSSSSVCANNFSTTCCNATEVAQWATPVDVDHIQLRKMASDMVDPIAWPLPNHLHGCTPWASLAQDKCSEIEHLYLICKSEGWRKSNRQSSKYKDLPKRLLRV